MPTYVYECEDCGVRFDRLQSYSEAPLRDCPECNGHVHRVIQPVGVIFKGSGFYVTDNKGKSSTAIPAGKKEETAGTTTEGKSKSGDTTDGAASTPSADSTRSAESTRSAAATPTPAKKDN